MLIISHGSWTSKLLSLGISMNCYNRDSSQINSIEWKDYFTVNSWLNLIIILHKGICTVGRDEDCSNRHSMKLYLHFFTPSAFFWRDEDNSHPLQYMGGSEVEKEALSVIVRSVTRVYPYILIFPASQSSYVHRLSQHNSDIWHLFGSGWRGEY